MTSNEHSSQKDNQSQNTELSSTNSRAKNQQPKTNSQNRSATHLCITIRWRGAPPPAALANDRRSRC